MREGGCAVAEEIRIAIVDDDERDRERLMKDLRRYEAERGVSLALCCYADGEDLVTNYRADYDLILLDIEMRFMDGMRAAKAVRERDAEVPLIFVTNAPQYAIDGYKVRALDYLLKPVSWFSLCESLDRALLHRRAREEQRITVALRGGKTRLNTERLCYVEVQDHQLTYNTLDGKFVTKGAIRDAEELLTAENFVRCNRCYIINLKYVESWQGSAVTVNGDSIQVSRRQRKSVLDALNRYMNGDER